MRFVKKCLAAAAFAGALLVAGAAVAQDIRIVVVSHGQADDPFWSVVKNGVDEAARDMGVTVEYRAPDTFDMVAMARLIDAAVASRPDGLVVSIPDAEALGTSIKAAIAAGIPVVSMNAGSDVGKALGVAVHVGQTEFEAGLGGGQKMRAAGVTKALCVSQDVGNIVLDLRCEGFAQGLGGTVEVLGVSMDPAEVRKQVLAVLAKNADIGGVLTLGPTSAEPVLGALESIGAIGGTWGNMIQFGTFDLSPNILTAVKEGKMMFAIDQQQFMQGYLPVVILMLQSKYALMPGADVQTGPSFVTQENAAKVIRLSAGGVR